MRHSEELMVAFEAAQRRRGIVDKNGRGTAWVHSTLYVPMSNEDFIAHVAVIRDEHRQAGIPYPIPASIAAAVAAIPPRRR